MLLALVALGLDNILLALAPTIGWMFFGRAMGGVFGATMSIANAYIADTMDAKDRATGFGMIGAAFGVGFIIGPILGGILGSYDLRLPFYCAAGLSFANAIFGYFFLQETLPPEKRDKTSLSRANPFSTLKLLGSSKLLMLLGIALMLVSAMQRGLESLWVIFSQLQYGWNTQEVGFSLAIVGASYVFVQGYLVRIVVPKFGEINTIIGGFILSATMYVLLSFNTFGIFGYLGIIPHVIGWGCAAPALQAIASRQVGEDKQGLLQGALTSVSGLAAVAGPAIATTTFSYFTSPLAPIYFPGAFFLLGAFVLIISAWLGVFAGRTDSQSTSNTSS
jgi:DHA1 family tetracycline resistance protein-like MFS transporter